MALLLADVAPAAPPSFLWMMVLVGAVMAALAATIIDNRVKGMQNKRSHNSILLVNECLAEHQSAYVIYFIALMSGTEFSKFWIRPMIPPAVVLAFVFYVVGVSITADHESNIEDDHTCQGVKCRYPVPRALAFRMLSVNSLATLILVGLSVTFAWYAIQRPGP